ncbi:SPOR domain-containing protein [Geofilum sp. OHC36d9]|uniref:HU domain-containing protein n=1 Tax=Geofilum sp. OHC36d9 TaxID=3458413 RepID=UPI004034BD4C
MIDYISHLLHYHDCVIVPGLGGFVANQKSAAVDEEKHLFLPPVKEIGFNRSLLHNDGLLTNHIARYEEISYASAAEKIKNFVADLKVRIFNGEAVELGEIGTLRGDAIGNLLFTPKEVNAFLPDAFGLSSFHFEPVDYRYVVRMDREVKVSALLRSRSPRHWAAVAALMACFFLLTTTELKMPQMEQAGFATTFIPSVVAEMPAVQPDVSDVPLVMKEAQPIVAEPKAKARYHIIAASLKQSAKARAVSSALMNQGFDSVKVLNDGKGHFRVALESFEDFDQAVKVMNNYRRQSRFSSVWVYKSK